MMSSCNDAVLVGVDNNMLHTIRSRKAAAQPLVEKIHSNSFSSEAKKIYDNNMTAVAKHCCSVISILFLVMTCHFQSTSAFIIRPHYQCLQSRNEFRFTQKSSGRRNNKTCVAYKSTASSSFSFDIDDEIAAATTLLSNSNDELWQLIYELRQQELNSNDKNDNNNHRASADAATSTTSSGTRGSNNDDKLFQQVIKTLHQECQLNVQTLEREIDALRQKIENGSAADSSSKTMIQNDHEFRFSQHQDRDNCNMNNNVNVSNSSVNVDEISSKLLKAIFVGYQWTEDDRKRLASAHPLD